MVKRWRWTLLTVELSVIVSFAWVILSVLIFVRLIDLEKAYSETRPIFSTVSLGKA